LPTISSLTFFPSLFNFHLGLIVNFITQLSLFCKFYHQVLFSQILPPTFQFLCILLPLKVSFLLLVFFFTKLGCFVKLYTNLGGFKNCLPKIDHFDISCNYNRCRKVTYYISYNHNRYRKLLFYINYNYNRYKNLKKNDLFTYFVTNLMVKYTKIEILDGKIFQMLVRW